MELVSAVVDFSFYQFGMQFMLRCLLEVVKHNQNYWGIHWSCKFFESHCFCERLGVFSNE
jgi:hypothetical protein